MWHNVSLTEANFESLPATQNVVGVRGCCLQANMTGSVCLSVSYTAIKMLPPEH
jgi:hypothetical protein